MQRFAFSSCFLPCKNQRELLTSRVVFAVNRCECFMENKETFLLTMIRNGFFLETLFSSNLRHSCHCQFYFSVQWKRIFKRILASGNAFSGQWNALFIYFLDISASDSFFSSSENVVLKRILHSGQWKHIFCLVKTKFFPFLVKAFSVQCKLIFQKILHSGQWKISFPSLGNIF